MQFSGTAKSLALLFLCLTSVQALAVSTDSRFFQFWFDWPGDVFDLPQKVYDIKQDADGSLWLASAKGLVHFDGLTVTLYRVSTHPELLSNRLKVLFVDSQNRLFISSESGLSMFDGQSFKAIQTGNKWISKVHAFAEDPSGAIWVGSEGGLWQFRDGEIVAGSLHENISQIRSLHWQDGRLFAGSRGRVYRLANGEKDILDLPAGFENEHVRDIEYYQDKLWLVTHRGLLTVEDSGIEKFREEKLDGISLDQVTVDRDGSLWFLGREHLGRILPNGTIQLPDLKNQQFGFSPNFTSLFEDANGALWQSTTLFGITALRDWPVVTLSFTEGMPSPHTTAVTKDSRDIVYAGTKSGIAIVDGREISEVIKGDFSGDSAIRSLLADDAGRLWVGTQSGLRQYDLKNNQWSEETAFSEAVFPVNSIKAGLDDTLWVATDAGLLSVKDGQTESVLETAGLAIESLLIDSKGEFWLGTEKGVSRLINGVLVPENIEDASAQAAVVSIIETRDGMIVAATADRGITVRRNNVWQHFGESNGLPSEQILDVKEHQQSLLLITGSGVFRLPKDSLSEGVDLSKTLEPLVSKGVYRPYYSLACCRGHAGNVGLVSGDYIYLTSDDGLRLVPTNTSPDAKLQPMPYITAIRDANGVEQQEKNGRYVLSADNDGVTVEFSALLLSRGEHVQFRYRLLGHSSQWVNVDSAKFVQLQSLAAGEYVFELQASLNAGVWVDLPSSPTFFRAPRLTETRWFGAAVWLGVAILTGLLFWFRTIAIRRRYKLIRAEINERTAALADLNKELKVRNLDLQKSSQTDPLTGLVNRRYFEDNGEAAIGEEILGNGVLMTIDIDFFKRVNDAYGHEAGDEVLRQFSSVLRSCTRKSDLVARWGGEEFIVICRCPNDDAPSMLERINKAVSDHRFALASGRTIEITCSIGSIRYPIGDNLSLGDGLSRLMHFADAALYVVKMSGRDGWGLIEAGEQQAPRFAANGTLEPHLAQRIENEEISWQASRPEIGPVLGTTISRLHAIKGGQSR